MVCVDKNDSKVVWGDYKYNNSPKGFITIKISQIFKPSSFKFRPGRNTIWKPDCTKEDIYQKLMNYIIIMKEKYPESNGYLCNYCKNPFTYKTNMGTRGSVKKTRSKSDPAKEHNFSIDRWDPRITYTYDNIRFACLGCNNRKSSSTPNDWDNFKEATHDYR